MKLSGTINRLTGVEKNIDNAISFLQVQDGVLESAGKILDRMAELKALSQDVLKNSSDIANYNAEFQNLQVQLYQMSETKFNGVSLFGGSGAIFGGTATQDETVSIFTSATGESGSKVSINKAMLLSALTIDASDLKSMAFNDAGVDNSASAGSNGSFSFASQDAADTMTLNKVSVAVYTQAFKISPHFVLKMEDLYRDFSFLRKVLLLNAPILKLLTAESWMWILHPKVHAWPSLTF